MKNKVVCELGPDYASPRGECTMLPPYSGIPRSIVFDGHVVPFPWAFHSGKLRDLPPMLSEPASSSAALSVL